MMSLTLYYNSFSDIYFFCAVVYAVNGMADIVTFGIRRAVDVFGRLGAVGIFLGFCFDTRFNCSIDTQTACYAVQIFSCLNLRETLKAVTKNFQRLNFVLKFTAQSSQNFNSIMRCSRSESLDTAFIKIFLFSLKINFCSGCSCSAIGDENVSSHSTSWRLP